ncbi:MAG: acylneuraminate cytidylyltransferase family protein [Betaproteobacteria bacterium]|nr:acylneuraminate cytidylyltransferase family protein [Betaproteobacteria bacterium]
MLGVSPAPSHPQWCFKVDGASMSPFIGGNGLQVRSQDLPPAYVVNGNFYLIRPDELRKRQAFHADDSVPLINEEPDEGLDIDTERDWTLAETIIRCDR